MVKGIYLYSRGCVFYVCIYIYIWTIVEQKLCIYSVTEGQKVWAIGLVSTHKNVHK